MITPTTRHTSCDISPHVWSRRCRHVLLAALSTCVLLVSTAAAQPAPPQLTAPVNDFANVIDRDSARAIESVIRSLEQASDDAVVVATVDTIAPYGSIEEYAVKMFENGGRGIGRKGKDNGILILVAVNDRRQRIEVGYDLEQFITDGFAGETMRQYMAPEFRDGDYGSGLLAGVSRIAGRIAEGRNVTLQGVKQQRRRAPGTGSGRAIIIALFTLIIVFNAIASQIRGRRGFYRRRWGGGPWSGWSSGVGPFGGRSGGGGFGGFGGGGGGFGGGFGGFGGGRSGGGGASGGW